MTSKEVVERAHGLFNLISSPLAASIYQTHPNDLAFLLQSGEHSPQIPPEWITWWRWSGECEDAWKVLVELSNAIDPPSGSFHGDSKDPVDCYYTQPGIPTNLARLLHQAKTYSLPRQPLQSPRSNLDHSYISFKGMSPKKVHEVSRMTGYVLDLLDDLRIRCHVEVHHIVDIGAGQGYLARSLCDARNLHILALDSQSQTEGPVRRSQQSKSKGTLVHRKFWLGGRPVFETHPGLQGTGLEDMYDLRSTINEWMCDLQMQNGDQYTGADRKEPVPVLFIALHACGSLTPAILQEVLNLRQNQATNNQSWFVTAAVVVGCCYNLMQRSDFPLSQTMRTYAEQHSPDFELSSSHLQLAAQVPSQWFNSLDTEAATQLAMKKILYRALITPLQPSSIRERSDAEQTQRRIGKLNVKAHDTFQDYLIQAGQKMGIDFVASYKEKLSQSPDAIEDTALAIQIKTLHALRCLLGPPVESLIILDRFLWLEEHLRDSQLDVRLVNLFDQEAGSGRNVAIALVPVT